MFGHKHICGTDSSARRGVSALEFLGIFAALSGGVVLGTIYLGVDVKSAALHLLNRTTKPAAAEASTPPASNEVTAPQISPVAKTAVIEAPKQEAIESESAAEPAAVPHSTLPFTGSLELT